MATQSVDQITGWGETLAYKAPVRVTTTANITLSGLQTIDGVTVAASDRVLVKNQTDARANGIYIVSSGLWSRARDMDSNRDITKGTRVAVNEGSTLSGSEWRITSSNPISLGVDNLTFSRADLVAQAADQVDYAEEWAQKAENTAVSVSAGGNGSTDRSSLHWSLKAKEWANKAEDSAVSTEAGGNGSTTYSALHWAAKAEDFKNTAEDYGGKFMAGESAPTTRDNGDALVAGDVWLKPSTRAISFWDGSAWFSGLAVGANIVVSTDTGDGGITYALDASAQEANTLVYIGGLAQSSGFTLVDGVLTVTGGVPSGVPVLGISIETVPIGSTIAGLVSIVDAGGYFTASTVEGALGEISESLNAANATLTDVSAAVEHFATPQMFGAVGDGVANDTVAVQAALSSGASHVHFPQGTYLVSGGLVPASNQCITGPGLLQLSQSSACFNFSNKENITFDGLQIRGTVSVSSGYSSPSSNEPGIKFTTCGSVTVKNCKFSRLRYVAMLSLGSDDVVFDNNEIFQNCFGARYSGGKRVSFRGNVLRDTCLFSTSPTDDQFNTGFVLDSTDGHIYGSVSKAVISDNLITGLGHSQAILCHGGTNITISGNVITDCGQGIACSGYTSSDYLQWLSIVGNVFNGATGFTMPAGSGEFGISVQGGGTPDPQQFVIANNVINAANRNYLDGSNGGIRVGYSVNGVVIGNSISGCGGNGIVLTADEDSIIVSGNVIKDVVETASHQAFGVYVLGNARALISANLLVNINVSSGSNAYGIYRAGTNDATLADNKFVNCANNYA